MINDRETILLRCTCGELVRWVHVDDEGWVRAEPEGRIHVCPDDPSINQADLWSLDPH